jgi:hypothetical protein
MIRMPPLLIFCLFLVFAGNVSGDDAKDEGLDCAALDRELAQLESQSYPSRPGFYDDPRNGAVLWGSLFWAPALSYYGYSGYQTYLEGERLEQIRSQIAALRQLKAERHCYER